MIILYYGKNFAKGFVVYPSNVITFFLIVINYSLILIGISTGCTSKVLDKLLQSVFNAVVLVVGIDEVKTQKNIERLKRELRVLYYRIYMNFCEIHIKINCRFSIL